MIKIDFSTMIKSVLLLGALSVLLGVSQLMPNQADSAAHTKEGSMNLASTLETKLAEIPTIDKTAPADFETASFGLG